ncbi:MAG: hypothetical protein KGI50_02610 [Patescibacteria group bacterium]|nr:hypothetical protein [Patescibacteria group bacterium]MDE2438596.1 hypothetical protein [Patescibacteria group bacterium]
MNPKAQHALEQVAKDFDVTLEEIRRELKAAKTPRKTEQYCPTLRELCDDLTHYRTLSEKKKSHMHTCPRCKRLAAYITAFSHHYNKYNVAS